MFCNKCGNELREDAKFCDKCGAAVENAAPVNTQQRPAQQAAPSFNATYSTQTKDFESYKELGGILKYTVILYKYVAAVMFGLSFIVVSIVNIRSIHLLSSFSYGGEAIAKIVFSWLFSSAILVLATVLSIKLGNMIEKRDSAFLNWWQKLFIALVALCIITGFFTGIKSMISTVITLIITFILWNTYFTKSVRVRVYMGSDEYLRNSLFNKNTPSPIPNDTPFVQQNTYMPPVNQPTELVHQKVSIITCPKCGNAYYDNADKCPICGNETEITGE